jgi:hypothetical protein
MEIRSLEVGACIYLYCMVLFLLGRETVATSNKSKASSSLSERFLSLSRLNTVSMSSMAKYGRGPVRVGKDGRSKAWRARNVRRYEYCSTTSSLSTTHTARQASVIGPSMRTVHANTVEFTYIVNKSIAMIHVPMGGSLQPS